MLRAHACGLRATTSCYHYACAESENLILEKNIVVENDRAEMGIVLWEVARNIALDKVKVHVGLVRLI